MVIELNKVFPIQAIENGFMINGQGDLTVGFKVTNPEVFSLSKQDLQKNYEELISIIKLLPSGTLFHKQDFIYEYNHNPVRQNNTAANITAIADFEFYYQKPVLGSYSNIYITFTQKEIYKRGVLKTSFIAAKDYLFQNPFVGYEKKFAEIEKRILTLENSLRTLKGFEVRRMDNNDLGGALYDYFSGNFEFPCDNYSDKSIPPIHVKNDCLIAGDNIIKILSLVTEGNSIYSWRENITAEKDVFSTQAEYVGNINLPTSFVYPIGAGMPIKHILNTCIEVLDNELTEKELRSQIPSFKLLAAMGNTQAKYKTEKVEEYIQNINKFDYKSCRLTVNVILVEKANHDKLNYLVSVAQGAFAKMAGAQAWVENFDTANLFFSSCPGNARENPRDFLTTIDHAVCYLAKEGHYLTSKSGYLYCDRFGKPIFVDMFNSPHITNKNGVCFGPSGSGKSFWFNGFIEQSLRMGDHFIILDVGASYKMNCELNGGFYFDCADVNKLSFNVFANCAKDKTGKYLYKNFDNDGEGGEDKINEIYTVVRQIWKKGQVVTPEEKVIMKKMIENYYEHVNKNNLFPDYAGFVDYSKTFEAEMHDDEKGYFNFKGFRLVSKPYVSGVYKKFLNAKENIDLSSQQYIVFDVKGMESNEDIRDLLSVLIIQLTLDKIVKLPLSVSKKFVIDEALDFLKGDIGDFIAAMYRKIRKQGGSVLLATQDVSFLDEADPIVTKSIMKNSDIRILLGIESKESVLKDVQIKLDLSENDLEKLRSMKNTKKYREFFVKLGNYSQIYRNQVSLTSALAYTTEPKELDAIKALKEIYNGHLGRALNELVDIIKLTASDLSEESIIDLISKRYSNIEGILDERIKRLVLAKMN